jgi:hypothetical protein
MDEEEAGRPKIVLGRGLYEEDEEWAEALRSQEAAEREGDQEVWAPDVLEASIGTDRL